MRLPIVGVMGSGIDEHAAKAEPLGRWLAGLGVHLLTGGGAGVMTAVSRAFHGVPDRRGSVIGVLPGGPDGPPAGYPNPWVEIPIVTHLPKSGRDGAALLSRNHINVLTSVVVVALPGGHGTASEVALALRYDRPTIVWAGAGEIPGLVPEARVETDFEAIRSFVRSVLKRPRRRRSRST